MNDDDYDLLREQLVEQETIELLMPDGELYPFHPDRLGEALCELNDEQLEFLSTRLIAGKGITKPLGKMIVHYWTKVAEHRAEKTVPSAFQLWQLDRSGRGGKFSRRDEP